MDNKWLSYRFVSSRSVCTSTITNIMLLCASFQCFPKLLVYEWLKDATEQETERRVTLSFVSLLFVSHHMRSNRDSNRFQAFMHFIYIFFCIFWCCKKRRSRLRQTDEPDPMKNEYWICVYAARSSIQLNNINNNHHRKNAGGRQCASSCLPFVVWIFFFFCQISIRLLIQPWEY